MKKLLLCAFLLSAVYASAAPVDSASWNKNDVRISDYKDSVYYTVLHLNAPHLLNEQDVPRFALLGKEHKFYMGIGANIIGTMDYDFGNPISDPNSFTTRDIPMEIAPGCGGQFKLSAQQSNFYLNVVALPGSENQIGAFVMIKFLGHDYTPNLDQAYLKYRGVTIGKTFSIFTDAAANPPTIDHQGVNAATTVVHAMVGYERVFGKGKQWQFGVGMDMPNESYTNASCTSWVSQRIPDVPFYIQRNWSQGKGWIRFSGIIRNIYYRDLLANKNRDVIGWGIKTSGRTPVSNGLWFAWQGVYGKGIASYINDLQTCGLDMTPNPANPGQLDAVKAWAGFASLQYRFNSKCFATTTYGHVRTYANYFNDSSTPWATGYRYAQYLATNVFYNFNPIVQVGAEYLYGRRVDYDSRQAHDNRFQVMLKVSF